MHSLDSVIAAIRKEVEAVAAQEQNSPGGLKAERLTATLQFSVESGGDDSLPRLNFALPTTGNATNSLTIEFSVHPSDKMEATPSLPGSPLIRKLDEATSGKVTQELAKVFGEPGFDSSARATVLREAFENLSDAEVSSLIRSLAGAAVPASNPVKHALSLIKRICRAGPAGTEKGQYTLAQIFVAHDPTSILKLITDVWKTQNDWL